MTVDGNGTVVQWAWGNSPNQKWYAFELGDDLYEFKAVHSNEFMTVEGDGKDNGTRIIQSPPTQGSVGQTFQLRYAGSYDWYYIISPESQRVVELVGFSTDDGASIDLYDMNGGANQRWAFKPYGP